MAAGLCAADSLFHAVFKNTPVEVFYLDRQGVVRFAEGLGARTWAGQEISALFPEKIDVGMAEEALLFLAKTGILNLEGGFMVLYNKLQIERLKDSEVKEVILALNPNVEGEATTSFLSQLLSQTDIKVTRLASGLPVGGDLEYADEITLGRALAGRRAV